MWGLLTCKIGGFSASKISVPILFFQGHVSFPMVFYLFPYTVAANEGIRGPLEVEMKMQMKQSWSMFSPKMDFEIQLERDSVPWRSNFVSKSSCYATSISGNGCERNICRTAGQIFQPQDYKQPSDGTDPLTETVSCEDSHDCLKLVAEENGVQNTFFGDQVSLWHSLYMGLMFPCSGF